MAQQSIGTTRLAQRTSASVANANFDELYSRSTLIELTGITANTTFSVPAGYRIESIDISGNNSNAVTGGLKFGTTSGGTDVVAAQAVAGNSLASVAGANVLLRIFSKTVAQTVYVQPVTAWNSANVDVKILLAKVW